MTAKGTSKNCCCGGCSEPPVNRGLTEGALQPLQQYCCACVPKQICVTYACVGGDSVSAVFDLSRPCDPAENDTTSIYRGLIPIDGEMVSLELSFQVENGVCTFNLTSDYFYSVPDPITVDDAFRAVMCPRCQDCTEDVVEFSVDDACDGAATISVRPAANTSIPRIPFCCDCDDPCDSNPYADHEDQPCGGPCGGCDCICTTACITVLEGATFSTYTVSLCDYTYALPNGMAIRIVGNAESDCCEFELDTGQIVPVEEPANVAIGGTLNPCPMPTASWDFTDSEKYPPNDLVSVQFACVACGSCAEIQVTDCCVDSVPRILTATVDGGGDCCGAFTLPLVYDDTEGVWIGTNPTALCEHGIELRLACSPGQWDLFFTGLPCTAQTDSDADGSCNPIDLEFTIPANGVGCCGEGDVDGGTLTISVTE